MLGTWTDALYKYHPSLASDPVAKNRTRLFVSQEKTRDLRNKLPRTENNDEEDLRQQLKRTKELLEQQERLLKQRTGHRREERVQQQEARETREERGAYRGTRGRGRGKQGPTRGHSFFRGDPRLKN
jgi:hypothetical protein